MPLFDGADVCIWTQDSTALTLEFIENPDRMKSPIVTSR